MSLDDEELRGILRGVTDQISDVAREGRETNRLVRDTARGLDELRRYVYGSSPPPPGSIGSQFRDAFQSASDASDAAAGAQDDLADFKGRVMRELGAIRKELAPQSKALGIGVTGMRWLSTREGRTLSAAVAALCFALAAAVGASRTIVATRASPTQLPADPPAR